MRLTALITSFTGTFLVGWVVSPALRAVGLGIQRDLGIEKGPQDTTEIGQNQQQARRPGRTAQKSAEAGGNGPASPSLTVLTLTVCHPSKPENLNFSGAVTL